MKTKNHDQAEESSALKVSKKTGLFVSWSTGKDSMYMLQELKKQKEYHVDRLVTTINQKYKRVFMHGISLKLLRRQAECLGIPIDIVEIPDEASNEEYEKSMMKIIHEAEAAGVEHMAFGDLFLEDVRDYRIKQLSSTRIKPLFPLWLRPTDDLILEMMRCGIKALVSCVDTRKLSVDFLGRLIDAEWLKALPPDVDPCGEKGEFHSFVVDGPLFREAIRYHVSGCVQKGPFAFADIVLA